MSNKDSKLSTIDEHEGPSDAEVGTSEPEVRNLKLRPAYRRVCSMDFRVVAAGLSLVLLGGLLGYIVLAPKGPGSEPVCPCEDARWCERIKDTTRKEVPAPVEAQILVSIYFFKLK